MPPLGEVVARVRGDMGGEPAPENPVARRREADEWARSVGWRD
jgi:hypothetical protein